MYRDDNSQLEFELYVCPGKYWLSCRRTAFVSELRLLASKRLHPIPDYQCLSYAPDVLNNKLIVTVRRSTDSEIVAFTSAVILPIGPLPANRDHPSPSEPSNIFHTGLTCISPDIRRQGMTIELFARIFIFMTDRYPNGFWLTNLAEVPISLVSISYYATQVFPSPSMEKPTAMHLHIAESISKYHRDALLISSDAVFDPDHFVFVRFNLPGPCFRKSRDDNRFHHRKMALNKIYRDLLGSEGNEVLQVGYISCGRIVEASNEEEMLHRPLSPLQVM